MELRILGPLEVVANGNRLDLGGHRQQVVLASLALEANRLVPIARLVEAIYGEDLPPTSRVQVQICVSALRRLFAAHGYPDAIVTRSGGYLLRVDDGALDLHRYEELLTQARQARDDNRTEEAVRQYRSALGLWRGTAMEGLDSRLIQSAVTRLTERRISVNEDCLELELELGRHRDLVAELTDLVEEYPLRERLRGQLMLALYRSGRQAEALEAYRVARRRLIDELGLEPNEWLQQLQHAILTSDARLNLATPPLEAGLATPATPTDPPRRPSAPGVAEPAAVVPCLLPTDIADFTGRAKQTDAIEQQFALAAENPAHLAVPVIVMAGKPGVGKTTLAVHVSHRVAARYPDGQLFADLHGRTSQQVSPTQVLERFLRVLGVPGTGIPHGLEERAEMYRDLLSDRKMLIVLDNAGGEDQILPLLPGTPHSAVLITSRSRLTGLPGAIHIDLDVFDTRHSVELLSRIAGAPRVAREAGAATELAELCGHLPLALRIAGARLSARPHWSVGQLVERLENEARRLDELKHSGMGIRASISLTYDSMAEDARRLFRLLAVLDFPHFSGWVGAALLDQPLTEAQDLLDDLADAQLIETVGTGNGLHSHYRFHDLIRVFARERLAAEESTADRQDALERVLGALLLVCERAHRGVYGGDYLKLHSDARRWPLPDRLVAQLVDPPLSWFERERLTIVAAVRQAARAGFVEHCWDLALTAVTLFESRIYLNDWRETHRIALAAAQQEGNDRATAAMLYSTGSLHIVEQRFDEARKRLEAAAELFRDSADCQGAALVMRNIAFIDRMCGNFEAATDRYERALEIFRQGGDLVAAAYVLHSLAQIKLETGDIDTARRLLPEALELSRRAGSRRVEAQVLHRLGDAYLQAGEPGAAAEAFGQALIVVQDIGDPVGEAYALHGLGIAHLRTGETIESGTALQTALRLASTAGERLIEARVSLALGELALACGNPPQAVVHLHRALGLFRAIQAPLFEYRVLAMLTDAYAAAAGEDERLAAAVRPLDRRRELRIPVLPRQLPGDPEGANVGSGVVDRGRPATP
ncbi:BTAD domain-containing putative transcriptional regulator [Micromonospora sp. CPCC 206060]|uniref:AfsR/SARP family transcriptional regulator n=1 Tax=Micromonospora sp. CPCC 206060 TaxID=3122406 RepID=UPI002FEF4347